MCNFKVCFWNSTQNILTVHWKRHSLQRCNLWFWLRARKRFWNAPWVSFTCERGLPCDWLDFTKRTRTRASIHDDNMTRPIVGITPSAVPRSAGSKGRYLAQVCISAGVTTWQGITRVNSFGTRIIFVPQRIPPKTWVGVAEPGI